LHAAQPLADRAGQRIVADNAEIAGIQAIAIAAVAEPDVAHRPNGRRAIDIDVPARVLDADIDTVAGDDQPPQRIFTQVGEFEAQHRLRAGQHVTRNAASPRAPFNIVIEARK
jgi:hypothetical protein